MGKQPLGALLVNEVLTTEYRRSGGCLMDAGLVAAYAALGFSILAAGTMIGGTVYYFVNLLREPQGWEGFSK
jgi:hypothetical protein